MTAEEILQSLDAQFDIVHHDPPHLYQLWTHFYPADTRLTVFRSADHWAIVFEILGYWPSQQTVRLDIYVYGDAVSGQNTHFETLPLRLLDTQSNEPLDGTGSVNPQLFSTIWNDQSYDFAPSDQDYAEAGISFDPARPDPGAHTNAQIVRYLCERLNHPFFLPEEDLRDLLTQGGEAADTMTLLLQTRSWHHPDLSQEELPSQVRSFQILAHALDTGDISEWDRQNPASFNTDWRVYDWAEKAEEEQRREWESRQDEVWDTLPSETHGLFEQAGQNPAAIILSPENSGDVLHKEPSEHPE